MYVLESLFRILFPLLRNNENIIDNFKIIKVCTFFYVVLVFNHEGVCVFRFFFETRSHCVTLAVLEFTVYTKLALN